MPETAAADLPLPSLLREARGAYSLAIRRALAGLGLHDLPRNSAFVLGALHAEVPFDALVHQRRRSLDASGAVVALLAAGCLAREGGTVVLTERGHDAAHACREARRTVDARVTAAVGEAGLATMRAGLLALIAWKESEER